VALWTLGQVVESTAYVIEPYQKYPMLLDVLLSFLKTEQTASIRREVCSLFGLYDIHFSAWFIINYANFCATVVLAVGSIAIFFFAVCMLDLACLFHMRFLLKSTEKPKLARTFSRAGITGGPVSQDWGQS